MVGERRVIYVWRGSAGSDGGKRLPVREIGRPTGHRRQPRLVTPRSLCQAFAVGLHPAPPAILPRGRLNAARHAARPPPLRPRLLPARLLDRPASPRVPRIPPLHRDSSPAQRPRTWPAPTKGQTPAPEINLLQPLHRARNTRTLPPQAPDRRRHRNRCLHHLETEPG